VFWLFDGLMNWLWVIGCSIFQLMRDVRNSREISGREFGVNVLCLLVNRVNFAWFLFVLEKRKQLTLLSYCIRFCYLLF
jgi:hypothetical protein